MVNFYRSAVVGPPFWTMAPKATRSAPEKVIEDKDIIRQEHLFAEETAEKVADKTAQTRFPKYVQLQRQKRILMKRLKVPPPVNHFNHTLGKDAAVALFKFLEKYRPETKTEKKQRNKEDAEKAKKDLKVAGSGNKKALVQGVKNVTAAIESKKAQLVIIAHDVDPIELVIWMPALCRNLEIPYCIVKSKSRLGQIVGMKTCSCVALAEVKPEDRAAFTKIVDSVNSGFLAHYKEEMHQWGGGELSEKTIEKLKAQGKYKE